jgi:hypothetical protein
MNIKTTKQTYERCENIFIIRPEHVFLRQTFRLEHIEVPRRARDEMLFQ